MGSRYSKKNRESSLNLLSYSCCQCHERGLTDLHRGAGKPTTCTESGAHASLLLDCVAVLLSRSATAEIDIISSADQHHFHHDSAANRAVGAWLPQGDLDDRIQGALSA